MTILLGIGIGLFSLVGTLATYYVATGDWLWARERMSDARNRTPPR